jgi:carbon-monoxide dehydrogenase large subunit
VALRFTNVTPLGPYRGAGRPDIALMIERLVDEAAARTGRDPIALRVLNALRPDDFPYPTLAGMAYDSGDYPGLLDRAAATPAWAARQARRDAASARGALTGTGVALFVEVAGGGAVPRDEIRLRLETREGEPHVVIETTTKGSGQGHDAVWRALVADRLALSPSAVSLAESPPDTLLIGAGSFGSRSTSAVGNALAAGCTALIGELVARTAMAHDVDPEGLVCDRQSIRKADGAVLATLGGALAEAAAAGLAVLGAAPVSSTFPSGCHVAEVEIDRETGRLAVTGYTAIDDAGRVVSHGHVEAQIMGGVAQGLGSGLAERLVLDTDGQLLTASLMDYGVPRAADIPNIAVAEHNTPSPANPLGVKGVGEAGTTGAMAAVCNAVADACRSAGVEAPGMPFTPDRLWAVLHKTP